MKLWQHILEKLHDNQRVYLLTVVENIGSSPGRKGFKMLVAEDGFIFGSIGGGVMEFLLVEEAKRLLQHSDSKTLLKRQVHRSKSDNGSGMICSGEQTVVFHPLSKMHIQTIESLLNCLQQDGDGQLIFTMNGIKFSEEVPEQNFVYQHNTDEDWTYSEHLGFKYRLFIVGGGHVSVAVSDIFVMLGFHVVVFDDRENLNTLQANVSAHHKKVIDFADIADHIPVGAGSYVAVMTNRYIDDKLVVSKLAKRDFAYLGVLGSKAKLKTMRKQLLAEGFLECDLDRIYGPIGIAIKSQTPTEIAISIAAEVIKIKNRNQ